ncbi:MAG: ribose 5-phosphate isomerase B [Nitrospirota bacterium]|jgi:ribose 5-phosphate isomerase B
MKIAIGSDHAGLALKGEMVSLLREMGSDVTDMGTDTPESVDYPDFGDKVSSAVSKGEVDRGVLICGTGIGMSIVANKHRNVRAALCSEPFSARMSRLHNDANVLVLGGRVVGSELAKDIARVWMETPFEGGRHLRRLQKISSMEEKRDKTKE